jgi:capsular exopolysaccharide synthesis family protein
MGLRDLGHALRRGIWLVLGGVLLGAGLGAALALRAAPVYEAAASIRIEEPRARLPGFEAVPAEPLSNRVETEMEELRTRSLVEEVVDSLGLMSRAAPPPGGSRAEVVDELQRGIAVSRPNAQADVVRVAFQSPDRQLARDVANALAARFLARRQRTAVEEAGRALRLLERQLAGSALGSGAAGALQARLLEARAAAALLGPGARVIDPAVLPRAPVRPQRGLIVGLATVAGLVLGVVAALARAQLDRSVRTRAELLRATQLPVLGVVPRVRGGRRKPFRAVAPWAADGGKPRSDPAGTGVRVAEAFRAIRATACAAARRRGGGLVTLVVAGPAAGEGKTTSAANLAFVAAREGQRVLLVDADPGGGLSGLMDAAGVPGFHDVLWGTVSLEEAVRRVEPAGGGAVHFLPGGAPPGPGGLPGGAEIARVLGAVRQGYDLVVVDSPGLGASLDAALLGAQADGVILVARAGRTRSDALRRAVETLQAVDAPLLGVVLNDANPGDA